MDRKMHREETAGERFPIPIFRTRLGAAHEDAPSSRVKAMEENDECALIRVVPPVFRSLWGFGCRCFFMLIRKGHVTLKRESIFLIA